MKVKNLKLKTSYTEDIALIRDLPALLFTVFSFTALALLPFFASSYFLYLSTLVLAYSIALLGQNILIGYTGLISFGQSGFLAVGAYTFAHLVEHIGFFPALFVAGLVGALFGAIVGFPALRIKGPYLAIATLGFSWAVWQIVQNTDEISGGRMGLEVPKVFPSSSEEIWWVYLVLTFLLFAGGYKLVKSHIGRAFQAIRESEVSAEVLGINLTKYKIISFSVSSFYTALGGALEAYLLGHIDPVMYDLTASIYMFCALVVGGLGTVFGSVLGAIFIIFVPQLFGGAKELVPLVLALAIIFVMMFEPLGLYGRWLKTKLWFMTFPFR